MIARIDKGTEYGSGYDKLFQLRDFYFKVG